MKSTIALILAMALCLSVLVLMTGCNDKEIAESTAESATEAAPETEEPVIGQIAGGWTVSSEAVSPSVPEEAKAAFDKAMEGFAGVGYEPIAYLGSQVVAGVNYAFLCRATTVTAEPVTSLAVVKVYQDLDGNASILDTKEITIADYVTDGDIEFNPNDLAGGWKLNTEAQNALPDDVQTAFDKAMEGFTGVGYQPLAYLGSQVVAGSNYAVLCAATSVTAEPATALAVVTVYADLSGGAQILSISGFDFP